MEILFVMICHSMYTRHVKRTIHHKLLRFGISKFLCSTMMHKFSIHVMPAAAASFAPALAARKGRERSKRQERKMDECRQQSRTAICAQRARTLLEFESLLQPHALGFWRVGSNLSPHARQSVGLAKHVNDINGLICWHVFERGKAALTENDPAWCGRRNRDDAVVLRQQVGHDVIRIAIRLL